MTKLTDQHYENGDFAILIQIHTKILTQPNAIFNWIVTNITIFCCFYCGTHIQGLIRRFGNLSIEITDKVPGTCIIFTYERIFGKEHTYHIANYCARVKKERSSKARYALL